MRGTGLSGGHFSNWKADANDSLTTGNWVVQQNWSNHEIFIFGASADGLGAFTTNYNSPEWLQSQYFIWTSSIGYEVIYPNGALLENLLNRWIYGTVRPDDVDQCYMEFLENEAQTTWWDDLTFTGNYQLVTKGQFGFWAGWYDIFLVGNLAAYKGYNEESDPSVRGNSVLLIDVSTIAPIICFFYILIPSFYIFNSLVVIAKMLLRISRKILLLEEPP